MFIYINTEYWSEYSFKELWHWLKNFVGLEDQNGFQMLLAIFAKHSILDVLQCSEYATTYTQYRLISKTQTFVNISGVFNKGSRNMVATCLLLSRKPDFL